MPDVVKVMRPFRGLRRGRPPGGAGSALAGTPARAIRLVVLWIALCFCPCPPARGDVPAQLRLPDGADVFEPPVLAVSRGGGAIADGLRTAGPGEIVTLAGDFKEGVTTFEVFGQTTANDAYRASVKPVRMDDETAVLILPQELPARSTYLIWPSDGARFGEPFAVNRTEAWWAGPREIAPGARFSIFGRNLTNGTGRAAVFLTGPGIGARRLPVISANPYRLELEAPDLPAGAYELWTHNGGGGERGWSGPLRLEIARRSAPASAPVIDVRLFGAVGDGVHDDGPAIESALSAAADRTPSRLYFPPGVYVSRRTLAAPSGVTWLGAGPQRSVLRFVVTLRQLGMPAFLYSPGDRFDVALEGLAVEGDHLIGDGALVALSGAHVRFRNFRLSSWGGQTLRLTATDVLIEDGEVVGSGSFLSSSSQVFVSRTTFRMTNDGESAIASWGGHDIAFTDNRLINAAPARSDGNGVGRLFVAQPHFGSARNLYFSGNETTDSAPRDCAAVDCNKGEQIILEFSGVTLRKRPDSITRAGVTFRGLELASTPGGADVVVAGGRGLGQRRRIVAAADGALTLDRPWDVLPDPATSRFFVTPVAEHVVIYRNRFQGRATHSEHYSNSTAVLVWGLCFDVVVAENDISRMRHGVMVAATSGTPQDSVAAPFFPLVENNRIRDGYNGLYAGLTFGYDTDRAVSGAVGAVFRGNDMRAMSNIGIAVDTWDTSGGDMRAAAFERNRISGVRYGVVSALQLIWQRGSFAPTPLSGTRLLQTVLHANVVERGAGSGGMAFRSDAFQDWIDIGGVWAGFPPGDRPPALPPR